MAEGRASKRGLCSLPRQLHAWCSTATERKFCARQESIRSQVAPPHQMTNTYFRSVNSERERRRRRRQAGHRVDRPCPSVVLPSRPARRGPRARMLSSRVIDSSSSEQRGGLYRRFCCGRSVVAVGVMADPRRRRRRCKRYCYSWDFKIALIGRSAGRSAKSPQFPIAKI